MKKTSAGRPEKETKRNYRITYYCTFSEKKELQKAASNAAMDDTEYLRKIIAVFFEQIKPLDVKKTLK